MKCEPTVLKLRNKFLFQDVRSWLGYQPKHFQLLSYWGIEDWTVGLGIFFGVVISTTLRQLLLLGRKYALQWIQVVLASETSRNSIKLPSLNLFGRYSPHPTPDLIFSSADLIFKVLKSELHTRYHLFGLVSKLWSMIWWLTLSGLFKMGKLWTFTLIIGWAPLF